MLIVGNPANTNAYIAMRNAPGLNPGNFSAMMRLDYNRALSQASTKIGKPVSSIRKMIVWGNHSPTQYPDLTHAEAEGAKVLDLRQRSGLGGKLFHSPRAEPRNRVIAARGLSSAASAANAAIGHVRDWVLEREMMTGCRCLLRRMAARHSGRRHVWFPVPAGNQLTNSSLIWK